MRFLRSVCLALALLLVFGASPAEAQLSPKVYLHAGGVIPQGGEQFSDFYRFGPHVGGGVGLALPGNVEIILAGRYYNFPADEDGIFQFLQSEQPPLNRSDFTVNASGASMLAGELNVKFYSALVPGVNFYFAGGVGLYQRDLYDANVFQTTDPTNNRDFSADSQADEEINFGVNFGLGVSTAVTPAISVYLEPHYTLVFSSTEDDVFFFPIQIGTSYSF